jgi:hypothetical protein
MLMCRRYGVSMGGFPLVSIGRTIFLRKTERVSDHEKRNERKKILDAES